MQQSTQIIQVEGPAGIEPIAVLERSQGSEPFVAWHGITAVNQMWFWDVLWPLGNVLLASLPGHGLPAPAARNWQRWTPQHFIEVGIATLRELCQGRPATLIGHSTGGMIALGVAQQAPELVKGLILIAPVVWHDLTGIISLWQRLDRYPLLQYLLISASIRPGQQNKRIFVESLHTFIADRSNFYSNAHVQLAIDEGYETMCQIPIRAITGVTRVLSRVDLRPSLIKTPLHTPTLLIHGKSDPVVPFAQAEWLAKTLPNCQLAALPGIGHLPYGEQEQQTNQIILNWLKAMK